MKETGFANKTFGIRVGNGFKSRRNEGQTWWRMGLQLLKSFGTSFFRYETLETTASIYHITVQI